MKGVSRDMKENFGYVLVPKIVVDEGRKIKFMYREEPESTHDSGWRMFSGDEDQEYVDNPDNLGIYDINTILTIDADIESYLDAAYGSAFERQNENEGFVPSEGFTIG